MADEPGLAPRQGEALAGVAGVTKAAGLAAGLIAAHVMQVDLEPCPAVVRQNMHPSGEFGNNHEFELTYTVLTCTSNFIFAQ